MHAELIVVLAWALLLSEACGWVRTWGAWGLRDVTDFDGTAQHTSCSTQQPLGTWALAGAVG